MEKLPNQSYEDLMKVVRSRFDTIKILQDSKLIDYSKSEIAAFHGRKIIEAIAFGCLIALKNGIKTIPKDAVGQYNAEKIFKKLKSKGIDVFPSPSDMRETTVDEFKKYNAKIMIEGIPERRITYDELIKKYQRMHNWLHELNPYTKDEHEIFYKKNYAQLWKDLNELNLFLDTHVICFNNEAFFCILKDRYDGLTKVMSLAKISELE